MKALNKRRYGDGWAKVQAGSWHGPEAAFLHHHDLVQALPDVLLRDRRQRHVHRRRGVGSVVLAEAPIGQWTVVRRLRCRRGSSARREVELGSLAPELDRGDVVGARGVLGGVERAKPLARDAGRGSLPPTCPTAAAARPCTGSPSSPPPPLSACPHLGLGLGRRRWCGSRSTLRRRCRCWTRRRARSSRPSCTRPRRTWRTPRGPREPLRPQGRRALWGSPRP
jgi:hypothetical protein